MVDRVELETSLKAVREAHGVLNAFHSEVVAFLQIVDSQLGEDGQGIALTPHCAGDAVWTSTTKLSKVTEWLPDAIGRLYCDEALDVAEDAPETSDSRAAALVSIYVGAADALPECWFGLGRPGEGTKATDSWNFGRNGLWNYGVDTPPLGGWAEGTFSGSWYGTGGIWHFSRVSLLDLTDAGHVRELVAQPLLRKWKEVIRGFP